MALKSAELSERELDELQGFLARIEGGLVPNVMALDGFLAALACCPETILPSEYMPVIQSGSSEDGDLVFEDMDEATRFMELVGRHWNHVNAQLSSGEVYLPLLVEGATGKASTSAWANGFVRGTELRREIWSEMFEDEARGGSIIPIFCLAYEDHPDTDLRPFEEPIDDEKREQLVIGSAAGVMQMYRNFLGQRDRYAPMPNTYVRPQRKIGRNEPCPCGSGMKFKKCCGQTPRLHQQNKPVFHS